MSVLEQFADEEELRRGLDLWRSLHDCVEARCTVNPAGQVIGGPNRPRRRGMPPGRIIALWARLKPHEPPPWAGQPETPGGPPP